MSDVVFLTIAEVAAKMRVSKMTVYRLVHNGELPAVRVGRSFRVTEDDVNEYLAQELLQRRLTSIAAGSDGHRFSPTQPCPVGCAGRAGTCLRAARASVCACAGS